MSDEISASDAVLNFGNHISNLVLGTLMVCLVKILSDFKIVESKELTIEVGPFRFRHELFWIIPLGATVLHALFTYYFVEACIIRDDLIRSATAHALVDGDPLLFGGIGSMKKWIELPILGGIYPIPSLLTRFLFYSWMIILFLSLYKGKNGSSWISYLFRNLPAIILCIVNWAIGGQWVIAASRLFK